ncbi:MAG: hypothetical protein RMJ59_01775 [Candidatus Nitrosocaldus sp.]|nr:hypothetical protein [Candidatus Nitrosocaldus sp.]MCS7140678.1 hypothetical protein [Candidatus Nitrosocaldus sp.]MDW7999507.1 hypothetical protein [Candidatus Nitrosocaldus sp.]MDW8275095.1 hypothetical protein [Candidatus Nitrosocaldus sp.]
MSNIRSGARRRVTIQLYIDAELYEALYLLSIQLNKSVGSIIREIVDHSAVPVNADGVEALLLEHPMVKRAMEIIRSEPDDCVIALGSRGTSS